MGTAAWADGVDALRLPPLDGPTTADAAVVGLGASGLSAVERLLDRGLDVVAIDAEGVAAGAAGRNGGLLLAGLALFHHEAVAAIGAERATAAYRLTLAELDRMAERWPSHVRRTGSLRIAASSGEVADCEAHAVALRRDGIAAEPYDGPEGVGLLLPDDAVLQPLARCTEHARELADRGARLHGATAATAIGPGRVDTPAGPIEADVVVICIDGGLERVAPSLAGRVRSTRLQMLSTVPTEEVRIPRPVYHRWGYDYWQQLPDGRLAVGGGRDLAVDAEWDAPAEPSDAIQAHLDRLLREVIGTTAAVTRRWAGTVAYTEDRMPVVEILQPGVAVAGGYSGHGNLLGPLCGRAAVDLLADGASPIVDLLSPPTLQP